MQYNIRYNLKLKKKIISTQFPFGISFFHKCLLGLSNTTDICDSNTTVWKKRKKKYHFLTTNTSSDYKDSSTLMEWNVWIPRSQKLFSGGSSSHTQHSLQDLHQYRRCGILVPIPKQIAIRRHLTSVPRNGGNLPTRLQ